MPNRLLGVARLGLGQPADQPHAGTVEPGHAAVGRDAGQRLQRRAQQRGAGLEAQHQVVAATAPAAGGSRCWWRRAPPSRPHRSRSGATRPRCRAPPPAGHARRGSARRRTASRAGSRSSARRRAPCRPGRCSATMPGAVVPTTLLGDVDAQPRRAAAASAGAPRPDAWRDVHDHALARRSAARGSRCRRASLSMLASSARAASSSSRLRPSVACRRLGVTASKATTRRVSRMRAHAAHPRLDHRLARPARKAARLPRRTAAAPAPRARRRAGEQCAARAGMTVRSCMALLDQEAECVPQWNSRASREIPKMNKAGAAHHPSPTQRQETHDEQDSTPRWRSAPAVPGRGTGRQRRRRTKGSRRAHQGGHAARRRPASSAPTPQPRRPTGPATASTTPRRASASSTRSTPAT